MKKWSWWVKILVILVLLFGLIQLVPYGKNHQNPAVVTEATFDSPATKQLAVDTCYDCHSNETTWPWYSNVAPVSWLIQNDVEEGRQNLNFSDWSTNSLISTELFGSAALTVTHGKMPPFYYAWLHPKAKLTAVQTSQLIQGLQNSAK
jgi:mono/diheme cytochrome c family protein